MSNIYKHTLLAAICFCFFVFEADAQPPNLKYGRLDNGFTYYIMGNTDFNSEVNFYLYQNVGSIVEQENQIGLAHFLEHMAFNKSEHFPDGIMNFLKNNGINTFNAQTGINETLYSVYNIPNDSHFADSILFILKDWCNGLALQKRDFEKEKRIITEEWRQRNDIDKRISDSIAYPIYNYSEYSSRNIIGSERLINNYKIGDLVSFYKKWYKPNLQCIAIIGDIDPIEYEKKVKCLFGNIPTPKSPVKRDYVIIESNSCPIYYRFIDKQNVNNSFGIYQRIQIDTGLSYGNLNKNHLLEMIFNKLAAQKLSMIRNNGSEEFIAATVSYSPLVRMYAQNAWDVVPYEGRSLAALKQVLQVREGFRRNGFSDSAFESVKRQIYDDLKSILESDNLGTPDNYMEIFKQNYLNNKPIITFREQLNALMEELVELESEDLNSWIKSWMSDENLSFITYSSNPDDMNISLEDFQNLLNDVKNDTILELEPERRQIDDIIDFAIKEGAILDKKSIVELETEEWVLSNGARLLYKFLPEMKDGFYFVGSAMGGNSLVESEDIPSYNAMKSLIMKSGVYKYDRNQLYDWVKNKDIELNINITDYTDGIGGYSSIKDAEDYFKYLYLVLTHQNFEKGRFNKYVEREKYIYRMKDSTGIAACQDSIKMLLYPNTELNPKIDIDYYNRMNYDDLSRLFNDRYGNASDFTFCLVGALPVQQAESLIAKYIASLPGIPSPDKRKYKSVDHSSPDKVIRKEFYVETNDNIGEVELSFINNTPLSEKEKKAIVILESILQNILFTELREKAEGTYNVGVRINYTEIPNCNVVFNVHFSTESSRVDELKGIVYKTIKEISNGVLSDKEFKNSYAANVVEEQQNNAIMEDNNEISAVEWLSILNTYAEMGEFTPDAQKDDVKMESITKGDVVDLFNRIINGAKERDIVIKSRPLND